MASRRYDDPYTRLPRPPAPGAPPLPDSYGTSGLSDDSGLPPSLTTPRVPVQYDAALMDDGNADSYYYRPPPTAATEVVRRPRRQDPAAPSRRSSPRQARARSLSLSGSRSRSRSGSSGSSAGTRDRAGPPDATSHPLGRAGDVLKESFSNSKTGLGVGLLGAAVGAWVAHEASGAHRRRRVARKGSADDDDDSSAQSASPGRTSGRSAAQASSKTKLALTVLGAVVGGLGANALEKRFQVARNRDRPAALDRALTSSSNDSREEEDDDKYDADRHNRRGSTGLDSDDRYSYPDRRADESSRRSRRVDSSRGIEYSP